MHGCVTTLAGGVKCWRDHDQIKELGELGDGLIKHTPLKLVNVKGLEAGVKSVVAGASFSCALTATGGVKCWGSNVLGQLGDGTFTNRTEPVDVSGLSSGVVGLYNGPGSTCASLESGEVKCWGLNDFGLLGNGANINKNTPVLVTSLKQKIESMAVGAAHSCALTTAKKVYCWGRNNAGQLGNGYEGPKLDAQEVKDIPENVISISTFNTETCALTDQGTVKCWGNDFRFPNDANKDTFHRAHAAVVKDFSGVKELSVGLRHNCAITTVGGVKCWGDFTRGQLGDGTYANTNSNGPGIWRKGPVDVILK